MYLRPVHLCYVDESGNDQVLDGHDAPPVLVLVGLSVTHARLPDMVHEFLRLKRQFNPQACGSRLTETIRWEVKGSDLRADLRSPSRRRARRALAFLRSVLDLLDVCNASIDGEVWVKANGQGVPQAHYPTAISNIALNFHGQLAAADSLGVMILDARTKWKNVPSVHSITTRKNRVGGDQLPLLIESPVFGHSDAHVALQVADIVASALVFPMACAAYCRDLRDTNAHGHASYEIVRQEFGLRLRNLEHRYTDKTGERRGGIVVRDKRGDGRAALDLYGGQQRRTMVSSPRARRRTRGGVAIE